MRYQFPVFRFFVLMSILLVLAGCSDNPSNSSEANDDETPPEPESRMTFGGSSDDFGKSILGTTDGGIFISGTTRSTDGDFSGLSRGNRDVFAVKLSVSGSVTFLNTYGGTNSDWAMDSAEDSDGNLYITGYSRSNDQQFSQQNRGENDLFLMKIAPNGTLIWAKTYGGTNEDYGYALQIINDQVYIAGATRSTDVVESDKTGTHKEILVLKTDLNGDLQWIQVFGSSGNDEALNITQTDTGNIAITGFFETGDGLFDGTQPGVLGSFVAELDSEGTIQKVKAFGGSGTDVGQAISVTQDNGYIIGGESDSADGDFSGLNAGDKNGFLLKVNENFETVWVLPLYGNESDEVHSVYPVNDNLWAAVGETRSADFLSISPPFDGQNAFLILIDSDGNIQEARVFGGSRSDIALDVTVLNSGELAISGWTISNDGLFSGQLRASLDTFFLKISPDSLEAISGE